MWLYQSAPVHHGRKDSRSGNPRLALNPWFHSHDTQRASNSYRLDAALAVLRISCRCSADRLEAAYRLALASTLRSSRYTHLQPTPAAGQDQTAGLRPPREEPVEHGGNVLCADYYAGGSK